MFWKKRQRDPKDQAEKLVKRLLKLPFYPDDWEEGQEIINTLIAIGEPAIKPMIYQFLGNPDVFYEDDYTVDVALALGHMGDSAQQELTAALHDSNPAVKEGAACALGEIGSSEAIEDLEWALWEDQSPHAVRALAGIGGDRAARNLLKAHECDLFKQPYYIIGHLGHTGSDLVFETVVQALGDEDTHVRGCAILSLGDLGDPKAVAHLVPLLDDPDKQIRHYAANVLAQYFHDPRAASVLAEGFSGDMDRRAHTAMLIAQSGNTDYVKQIYPVFARGNPIYVRLPAANALILLESQYTDEAAQLIQESLKSKDAKIRAYAIGALRPKEHQFTLEWLRSLTNDPDPSIRNNLAQALGWLGNPDAIEILQTWSKTEQHATVKRTIMRAIERIESRTAH